MTIRASAMGSTRADTSLAVVDPALVGRRGFSPSSGSSCWTRRSSTSPLIHDFTAASATPAKLSTRDGLGGNVDGQRATG